MRTENSSQQGKWLKRFEWAAVTIFMLAAIILLAVNAFGKAPAASTVPDPAISAYAYAMPNSGWAPLTVYFSALGTNSPNSRIVRYEWDMDGNGSFETDATGDQGYASYTYTKARDYIISMRATDQNGGTAQTSVVITIRHPASSSVDYWTIFDESRVRRVDIALDKSDWDKMWEDPMSKYQAKADAIVFGEKLEDVAFRMRGQFSLHNSGDKKPWKIDTDFYIDGQEYKNLRQLMFLNSIGDPSLLKEKLAYELMRFAGLPASHVSYVELWIDIRDDDQGAIFWGVYSMVERVDNKYIGNRFTADAKGGNLYKASHAQRGPMDLVFYGDQIEDYPTQDGQVAYGKMNNEAEADYSDIVALCRTVSGVDTSTEAEYIQALEASLNMDSFLRYLAVNMIIDNWDSYINTGNNFYLFNNPVSGRFEWIPWDLTWGENPQAGLYTTAEFGMMESGAPLFTQAMAIQKYRDAYTAYIDLLSRYFFTEENMSSLINRYHNLINPYVSQSTGDKAFYGDEPMWDANAFPESPAALMNFVKQRIVFVQTELSTELSTNNSNQGDER
jgi:spore coat protein H